MGCHEISKETPEKLAEKIQKKKTQVPAWADRVHSVMQFQGRRMDWLAVQVGLNRSQLSNILRGDERYTASCERDTYLIDQIARATGVPPDYFLGGEK